MYTVLTGNAALDYALATGVSLSRYGVNGAPATHGIPWLVATSIADGDEDSLFVEASVEPRADGWHSLELGYAQVRIEGGRPREVRHAAGPRRATHIDRGEIVRELEARDGRWVEIHATEWPDGEAGAPLVELDVQPTHFVFRRAPEGVWVEGLAVRQVAPGRLEGLTREDLATGEPSWRGALHVYDDGTPYELWEGTDEGEVRWEIAALPWAPALSPFPAELGPPLDRGRAEVLVLSAIARLALEAAGAPSDAALAEALSVVERWCRGGAARNQLERASRETSRALERAAGTSAGAAIDCVDWTCVTALTLERRPSEDGVDAETVQRVMALAVDALVAAGHARSAASARVDAACEAAFAALGTG